MPAAEVLIPSSGMVNNAAMSNNILNNNNTTDCPIVTHLRHAPTSRLASESMVHGVRERPISSSSEFAENSGSPWNTEVMSGSLILAGTGRNHSQSVQVKVYRTSLEHFAVVYPQKKVCRPLGVLNLKNAHVERLVTTGATAYGNNEALPLGIGAANKAGNTSQGKVSDSEGFLVRQRGFDSPFCLTFFLETAHASPFSALTRKDKDLEHWMAAFRSSGNPPAPTTPSPPASPVLSCPACSTSEERRAAGRRCNGTSKHPSCLAIVEEEEV